ncbi:unnamed protein product [Cuscuta europaea]|uniref:THO complex subunit 5B n=1 Tax=Cuscuta europaea TaxID=41803 RepID=A0A9P0YV61_CUSEU|nr:unnamed protein product [Cuscuta europaea]
MYASMAEPGEILPDRKPEKSPYEILCQSKASVEEIVSSMLSIKKNGESESEFRELITQMLLNFVTLRQANRAILLEEDRVKSETEHAKAPVDFTTLQLHNLMYEKSHYLKAIKACKDFKSKYPDIELVPEEEFFRDAPEEIKSSIISNDTAQNLMLKRLNFELFQRKELCELREKLGEQKKNLQGIIANRKKFLLSLPSHLKSLKKASLPVQHHLGVQHTKKLKQLHSAELLPPPLYVIFSQLLAQKEAFEENIEMEIVGSVKDAQTVARQQATKDTAKTTSVDSSKLDEDLPDEEDDGQRRRKRPRKAPSKESLDQTGIYQAHPLKVALHVHDDRTTNSTHTKLVTLKFEYLMKLNVVCVGVDGSQEDLGMDILCNLFPDDTGLELPHQSAKMIGNSNEFDATRTLRPYKWAQHLAGIDFLPEVTPLLGGSESSKEETAKHSTIIAGLSLYRQQNRVQTVVQRIRARKKAQLALAEQFDSLKKLEWPVLTRKSVPWTSHNHRCCLHSWSSIDSPRKSTLPLPVVDAEKVLLDPDISMDVRSDTSKQQVENSREDGELPSLMLGIAGVNDPNLTPTKGTIIDNNSRKLDFISKRVISPLNKGKSPSFKKYEEDGDLILMESDSDGDDPAQVVQDASNILGGTLACVDDKSWADCKVVDYILLLTRKAHDEEKILRLEAQVKISMEYPLRPPLFRLRLYATLDDKSYCEVHCSEWYNELRAMEAEVNVHIMKVIPADEENKVLAHQVHCLAMLFDFCMDDKETCSEKRTSTSVIDVGLCKPVGGELVSRSFRGRDRRKMISWKDTVCTPGYPY